MKITRYLTAAALCILSAASCTKELMEPGLNRGSVEMVLEAYPGEEGPETKTVLGSDGKSIYWEEGDQISLFFGNGENGGSCFTTADGGETASFTGSINAFTAGGEGYTGETTYFWGVYPYKSTTTCDNNSITINIPSVQPGKAGTFAPGVNISVGRSENLKMGFYNVCTSVSFTIAQEGITELLFKSKDGVSIVGDATVEFVSGKPAVVSLENGSDEVRIIPEEGEFVVGQKYYLEFIPITLDGFTATIYNNAGKEATFEYARTKEYVRSVPTNVSNLDARVGEWTVRKGNISFADPNFKAYCVMLYDKDRDGELSYAESAVVESLNCGWWHISSMDEIRYFTSLTTLDCTSNQLTGLDVSKNTNLTDLDCSCNQLTSLDVSKNTALEYLSCRNNQLTSLDVSKNTALTELSCGWNLLTSLDVSNNTALTGLWCQSNQLTSLDVSNNTAMESVECYGNPLTSLDVSSNTALKTLWCDENQLSNLDVSKNTALKSLACGTNQLTSLDVSKNTNLTYLNCCFNQLTSLDVSKNTALTDLDCSRNLLTSLDVSNNTALTSLSCLNNQLTGLDVSKNTNLTYLDCSCNQLTSLDVSNNTELTDLNCLYNQLTSLDVSNNTALTSLWCQGNQLTSLDVSNNTNLMGLYCSSMNDENGNNLLKTLYIYNGQSIPYITENRNTSYIPSETIITDADPGTNEGFGDGEELDGDGNITFADPNFKAYCVENFDTNGDGEVSFVEAAVVERIDCHGSYSKPRIITSLDGIQYFTSLTRLDCYDNKLAILDVSKNTALSWLDCSSNQLTSLDVSKNTALTSLECYSNQLTSLDVSKNTALTSLYCYSNQLTSLDVSKNTALEYLECYSNQLTSLDVSKNTALKDLYCSSNQLTSLDVSGNTALVYLFCQNNHLTSLDVSYIRALEYLKCYSNHLTSLDVSYNTALRDLDCSPMKDENGHNLLQTLYISSAQTITFLDYPSETSIVVK